MQRVGEGCVRGVGSEDRTRTNPYVKGPAKKLLPRSGQQERRSITRIRMQQASAMTATSVAAGAAGAAGMRVIAFELHAALVEGAAVKSTPIDRLKRLVPVRGSVFDKARDKGDRPVLPPDLQRRHANAARLASHFLDALPLFREGLEQEETAPHLPVTHYAPQ